MAFGDSLISNAFESPRYRAPSSLSDFAILASVFIFADLRMRPGPSFVSYSTGIPMYEFQVADAVSNPESLRRNDEPAKPCSMARQHSGHARVGL